MDACCALIDMGWQHDYTLISLHSLNHDSKGLEVNASDFSYVEADEIFVYSILYVTYSMCVRSLNVREVRVILLERRSQMKLNMSYS